jgi:subtilisin family serine protease
MVRPMNVPTAVGTLAAALFTLGCMEQATLEPAPGAPSVSTHVSRLDRQVVMLRGGHGPSSDFVAAVEARGGRVELRRDAIGVVTVTGLTEASMQELAARSDVEGAAADVQIQWIPSADQFVHSRLQGPAAQTDQSGAAFFDVYQWNMRQINAHQAWLTTAQGEGATVAILDTGLDPTHLDLAGKVDEAQSRSMVSSGSSPCNAELGLPDEETFIDFNTHGSYVGGLVTANGVAMASVAPDARLIGVKVLNCTGSGSFGDIIAGIDYASSIGADVINLSLGALLPKSDPKIMLLVTALQRAVSKAVSRGTLLVAAAGNSGLNLDEAPFINVPSQLQGVMSVGATAPVNQTDFDRLASYTNYGIRGVDVMAPGGDFEAGTLLDLVLSVCSSFSVFTDCAGGVWYLFGSGTSGAAPHASGAAAVVESETPGNSLGRLLERCVFQGADQIDSSFPSPFYGLGRINVLEAVSPPECRRVRLVS